ncbi:FAD-dependent monooxygenase [Neomicrococcus lactis]
MSGSPAQVESTDVLVIGAGPSGLMAANVLLKLGVRVIIIDAKSGPTRESRAVGVHSRSREIYRQLCLAEEVERRGRLADSIQFGFGRHGFPTIPVASLGRGQAPFPGIWILEQSENEAILAERLDSLGCPVRWNTAFVSLDSEYDGASVRTVLRSCTAVVGSAPDALSESMPESDFVIESRYVIAADGGSSPVRKFLQVPFEGATNEHVYYVFDANDLAGIDDSRVQVRLEKDDFLLAFPLGSLARPSARTRIAGIVRDWQPAAKTDVNMQVTDITEEDAREALDRVFGVTYSTSEWFSTYRVHHRVAKEFRKGNVFFIGDAAHVHSPVGAQGMNTGLQDGHNLACKIHDVLTGAMPESYLDDYERERRPVAQRLVGVTDRVFEAITSPDRLPVLLRTKLLPVVWPGVLATVPLTPIGKRLVGYVSQIRIKYPMPTKTSHPVLGRRLRWTGAHGFDNHEPLNAMTWQVHSYGDSAREEATQIAQERNMEHHHFPACPQVNLPEGTVLVVRPDMFVAAYVNVRGHKTSD